MLLCFVSLLLTASSGVEDGVAGDHDGHSLASQGKHGVFDLSKLLEDKTDHLSRLILKNVAVGVQDDARENLENVLASCRACDCTTYIPSLGW